MSRREKIGGELVAVALALLAVGIGTYFATTLLQRVPANTDAIRSLRDQQAQRVAAGCEARHRIYVSQSQTLDLLDRLIHQTDLNDPRIPENLRALAKENQAKSDTALAAARDAIAPLDCIAPTP